MMEWQCIPSRNVLLQRTLTLELTQFYKAVIAPIQGGLSSNGPRTQIEIKKQYDGFKKSLYINFTIMDCALRHQWLLSEDRPRSWLPNAAYRSQKGPIMAKLYLKRHTTGINNTDSRCFPHNSFSFGVMVNSFYNPRVGLGVKPIDLSGLGLAIFRIVLQQMY